MTKLQRIGRGTGAAWITSVNTDEGAAFAFDPVDSRLNESWPFSFEELALAHPELLGTPSAPSTSR